MERFAIPQDMWYLFALVMTTILWWAWFLIRSVIHTQHKIANTLDNHLREIARHMASTNTTLEFMMEKLLDAALGKTREEVGDNAPGHPGSPGASA